MTITTVDVDPLFLNDYTLVIDDDEFAAAISSATFTPKSSIVNFQGGRPSATFNFPTPATWTLDLEYAQDWSAATSLANYLHTNEGLIKAATFVPNVADDESPTVTANIIITPGAIGGKAAAVATSTVSLGVNGKPVITPAV